MNIHLSTEQSEIAKKAIAISLSIAKRNPVGFIALMNEMQPVSTKFFKEYEYDECRLAINELILFAPKTITSENAARDLSEMDGVVLTSVDQCNALEEALDLYMRIGIFQVHKVADHLDTMELPARLEPLKRFLEDMTHRMLPSISSKEIDPSFYKAMKFKDWLTIKSRPELWSPCPISPGSP